MKQRAIAKLLAVLALGVIAGGATAKAAGPDLASHGKLTYGTAATFTPFEYQISGKNTGFDIDFIAAIAQKMGLVAVPLNMDFNGLIPALQGHRIDIINSAMYMNPARARQVDFIPYMHIGEEILVKKGNPLRIEARSDLCGKRVAVTLGAIEETYAREDDAACKAAGKAAIHILTLPTAQDAVLSLRQGRADALYDSSPGAAEIMASLPGEFEVAGQPFNQKTTIGIAVRKGDTAMKAAIETAMHAVVDDGTYDTLLKKYHLPLSGSLFQK